MKEDTSRITGATTVASDILRGAEAIAEFLFGDRKHRRRVYNLVEGGRLPVFRIGLNLCARRSVLLDWIAAQEEFSVKPSAKPVEA